MNAYLSFYLFIAFIWFVQEINDKTPLPKAFVVSLFWGMQVLDELYKWIKKQFVKCWNYISNKKI